MPKALQAGINYYDFWTYDFHELQIIIINNYKREARQNFDLASCIAIMMGYTLNGKAINTMPSTVKEVGEIKPEYIELPSWKEDISSCKSFDELPLNAKNYVKKVEELTGIHFALISVGPDREQTIIRKELFND